MRAKVHQNGKRSVQIVVEQACEVLCRYLFFAAEKSVTVQYKKNKTAATLYVHGSRLGCNPRALKPLKYKFLGVTQPPGVAQPLYSRGHN